MDYKEIILLKARQVGKSYSSKMMYDAVMKHWAKPKSRIKSIKRIFNI